MTSSLSSSLDSSNMNLFTATDVVVRFPVEGTVVFVVTLMAGTLLEYAVDYINLIDNKHLKPVLESLKEEAIVLSIVAMLFGFAKSAGTGSMSPLWIEMLDYGVLILIFMLLVFYLITGSSLAVLRFENRKWRDFEETSRIDNDPILNSMEVIFKQCRDRFRETLVAKDLPHATDNKLRFSEYLRRVEQSTVASLTNLRWKSWIVLGVIIILNAVRARIMTGNSSGLDVTVGQSAANIGSYVGFVGYGSLVVYFVSHITLLRRVTRSSATSIMKLNERTRKIELQTMRHRLFFSKVEATAELFQGTILLLEWYVSVFVLGMAYDVYQVFPWYVTLIVYVFALLPLAIVARYIPKTVAIIAMLSSLGSDLDTAELAHMLSDLREHQGGDTEILHRSGGPVEESGGAPDEWTGERVTLHGSDPTLDFRMPSLRFIAGHPNAPMRRDFEVRPGRPVFPDVEVAMTSSDQQGRYDQRGSGASDAPLLTDMTIPSRVSDPFVLDEQQEFLLPPVGLPESDIGYRRPASLSQASWSRPSDLVPRRTRNLTHQQSSFYEI